MSKFDKYRVQVPQSKLSSKFAKYRIQPQQQEKGFLDRAKQFGSGLLSGFLEPAFREAQQQAQTGVMEVAPGVVVPISESSTMANIPQKGVESLESMHPTENDSLGKILHHAGAFGGGIANFPMMPGQVATNSAKSLMSNFAKNVGMGSAVGGASGILQEGGVNPLVADIGASIVTPSALNVVKPQNLSKIPMKLMGLTPKSMNIEAAQAARDLGIDLPAAALTNSKLTGLADQLVGKAPHFGEKLGEKYANAEKQTKNVLDKIYEEVGPKKTPEIESEIAKLYDIRAKSLPQGAMVKPTHLEKAINNIKINTAILSPEEKSLLQSLETIKNEIKPESNLITKFGKIKMPLQDFSVDKLVGTKKSLNQMIKWDTDEGIKNQLRSLQKAVAKDIEEYGKTNPEWYQDFKEADDLFSKVAKREKLETQLGGSISPSTDDLGYANLSKRIHTPKQLELIKKQVSPEVFAKIEKLGTVARAMAVKNRGIPNPSGTAITSAITGILGTIYTPQTIAAVIGTAGATKLLTDKKFLDLALKYAEKPNLITSMPLNKRIKDVTGYSATILNREINRSKAQE